MKPCYNTHGFPEGANWEETSGCSEPNGEEPLSISGSAPGEKNQIKQGQLTILAIYTFILFNSKLFTHYYYNN